MYLRDLFVYQLINLFIFRCVALLYFLIAIQQVRLYNRWSSTFHRWVYHQTGCVQAGLIRRRIDLS